MKYVGRREVPSDFRLGGIHNLYVFRLSDEKVSANYLFMSDDLQRVDIANHLIERDLPGYTMAELRDSPLTYLYEAGLSAQTMILSRMALDE